MLYQMLRRRNHRTNIAATTQKFVVDDDVREGFYCKPNQPGTVYPFHIQKPTYRSGVGCKCSSSAETCMHTFSTNTKCVCPITLPKHDIRERFGNVPQPTRRFVPKDADCICEEKISRYRNFVTVEHKCHSCKYVMIHI